jgi:hypothetical protein
LAYLGTPNGRLMRVDLGAKDHSKGMNLDRNDVVMAGAHRYDIQGQPDLIGVELGHKNKHAALSPFE